MAEQSSILVVSPTFPYPLVSGGKIRIYNILKQLAQGYKVTLLTLVEPSDQPWLDDENLSFLHKVIPVAIKQNKTAQLWRIISNSHKWLLGTPAEVLAKYSMKMRAELRKLLAINEFKAVQIEYSQGMNYLPPNLPIPLPVILVAHDVSFISQQRKATIIKGAASLFWRLEAKKMKLYELAIWQRCDRIIAMSKVDKQQIIGLTPNAKVEIVPNGVTVQDNFQKQEDETATIIFVGWMRHLPNRDGLFWFLDQIWPKIRVKNKNVRLQIVGMNVPMAIKKIAEHDEHVEFLGYITKIEDVVKRAWLSIVPIRIASGSRLKILESMSLKTPVISTTIGCEGLDVRANENIAVADEPEAFAGLVLVFLADKEKRQEMASKAYQLVKHKYSWQQIGDKARQIVDDVINN